MLPIPIQIVEWFLFVSRPGVMIDRVARALYQTSALGIIIFPVDPTLGSPGHSGLLGQQPLVASLRYESIGRHNKVQP